MNELCNILHDLNSKKTALWMQMCFVEVLAAMLAERLMANGTQIYINPDEIKWPDGTISKPCESKGKGQKKRKKNPNSKDGVYGRIVNEYGGHKKNPSTSGAGDAQNSVMVVNAKEIADTYNKEEQPKKKSRGSVCIAFVFSFKIFHSIT